MDKSLTISIVYSFIVASLSVMLPLYFISSGVDITSLGLILSLGPLSFTVLRLFFASAADAIGTRTISVVSALIGVFAVLFYLDGAYTWIFAIAIVAESVRAAGFWAVVRTETLEGVSKADAGKKLALFSTARQIADAIGRFAIGFALAYLAFTGSFALLLALSLLVLLLVVGRKTDGIRKIPISMALFRRIFRKRPSSFWRSALLQTLMWLPFNLLLGFILPVYLHTVLALDYIQIGILVGVISISSSASAYLGVTERFNKRLLAKLSLLMVPALIAIPFLGMDIVPALILLSFGCGCGNVLAEYILVDQVYRSREVSTDVAVLFVPLKVAEFIVLVISGMVISRYGFFPLFLLCAISILLFSVFTMKVLPFRKSPKIAGEVPPPPGCCGVAEPAGTNPSL